jgi:pimeloyl-ACP methyl ester carboxylesterase
MRLMHALARLMACCAVPLTVVRAQVDTLHVAHVRGVELHWVATGRGEPVVLLHGGQGDFRSWAPQTAALAAHYRVIAYSRRYHFPNHNRLTSTTHSGVVEAKDLYALLQTLHVTRVHLIGTSMGAATALVFALAHPAMVRSLVLAEPPVHGWVRDSAPIAQQYRDFMASVQDPARRAFEAGNDTAAMRAFVDGFAGTSRFDALPPTVRAGIMDNAPAMKAIAMSTDPYPSPDQSRVRALGTPVLIITGANTVQIHRTVNAILSGLLPAASTVTIPDAGHGSPRENPAAFNAAVLAFLDRIHR